MPDIVIARMLRCTAHSIRQVKRTVWTLTIALVVGMFGVSSVFSPRIESAVNETVNFQGKVVNSNGTNVTDGTYDFVVKVYDGAGSGASTLFTESWTSAALFSSTMTSAPSSGGESLVYSSNTNEATLRVGQILWNTTKVEPVIITSVDTGTNTVGISPTRQAWSTSDTITNRIYVKDGVFVININSLNQNWGTVDFNSSSLFVGVEFNSDGEMKPRMQFTSAPYAMNAAELGGEAAGSYLRSDTSDSYTSGTLSFNASTELNMLASSTLDIDGDLEIADTTITLNGASTDFTATGNITFNTNDIYIEKSSGYVGIGTTSLGSQLTVNGNFELNVNDPQLILVDSGAGGTIWKIKNGVEANGKLTFTDSDVPRVTFTNDGKVGIGSTSPAGYLETLATTTATAAGSYYATYFDIDSTGIFTTGTANIYGIYSDATASGISTGGTVNTYGAYLKATGENTGAATTNAYGLYVEGATGADNNYSAIFMNGNVGIGTANPDALLEVYKEQDTETKSLVSNVSTGTAAFSSNALYNGTYYASYNLFGSGFSSVGTAIQNSARLWTNAPGGLSIASEDSSGPLRFFSGDNYTPDLFIDTNGYVGIGATSPSQKLHLSGTSDTFAIRIENNSQNAYWGIANASANLSDFSTAGDTILRADSGDLILLAKNASGNIIFGTGVTDTQKVTILNSGSVGIGITAPTSLLHIYENRDGGDQIFLDNDSSGTLANSGIKFGNDLTGAGFLRLHSSGYTRSTWQNHLVLGTNTGVDGIILASPSTTSQIKFAVGALETYRMTIDGATGNIGINNDTPLALLDLRVPSTAYNSEIGSLRLSLASDTTERLALGWDDALNTTGAAYMQAVDSGVEYRPIYLNPSGGGVVVGRHYEPLNSDGLTSYAGMVINRNFNDAITHPLVFSKTRSGSILQNNDEMGAITFEGFDGTDYEKSAYIFGKIDGTPANNDMPGMLGFYTRPSGGASPIERLTIRSSGSIGIGTTGPDAKLDVLATSGEQLRLTYTDSTVYAGLTVDSSGYLTLNSTGNRVQLSTDDFLVLSNIANGSDPSGGTNGAMYYNSTSNKLRCYQNSAWTDCIGAGGSGANTALSNLASVAINTSLLPGTDNSIDLGSATYRWRDLYLGPASLKIYNQADATNYDRIQLGYESNVAILRSTQGGTGTVRPLQLTTGSNVGIYVNTSGDVGIGTTSLGNKLTVAGNIELNADDPQLVVYDSGAGGTYWKIKNGVTGNGLLTFTDGDTERVTFKNTGEVGIGTTGPDAKLDVLATSGEQLRLTYTDASVYAGLSVDTNGYLSVNSTGNRVQIGTDDFLVVASIANGSDPAGGTNGAVYYNSTSNKFRCYQNSAWTDCIGSGSGGSTLQQAYEAGSSVSITSGEGALSIDAESANFDISVGEGSDTGDFRIWDGTSNWFFIDESAGTVSLGTAATSGVTLDAAVTVSNALQLSGNDIKDSGGNTTISFDGSGGIDSLADLTGAGRRARTLSLNAEYSGAVLSAKYGAGTDTSITGAMTSDIESSSSLLRTYYHWSSTQASLNYYTVALRVTLPEDFAAWQTSNAIQIDYLTNSNTAGDNLLEVYIYNGDDTPATAVFNTTDATPTLTSNTWSTFSIDDSILDDASAPEWDAAGETAVIYMRMGSKSSNQVRVSDIRLNYLSKW